MSRLAPYFNTATHSASALDACAAAVAVAKIEAERAYQATSSLSERQRLAPLIATYRDALERFHREPIGRGLTPSHTDDGEPLADLLDAVYMALPNYAIRSQKLADVWSRVQAFAYRPRFRFLPDDGTGDAVMVDCTTGERCTFKADPHAGPSAATLARAMWLPRTNDRNVNAQGYSVASMWADDAAEIFAGR